MKEETKKALEKLLRLNKKVNELHNFEPLESGKPMHRYTDEEIENQLKTHEEQRQALKEYYKLFLEEQGKSQEEIREFLKRL